MNKYTSSNNKSNHLMKDMLVAQYLFANSAACVHNVIDFTLIN